MSRSRGFTLKELLAATAFLLVLLAVLAPVYWQARIRGQRIDCARNMATVAKAVIAYATDWDDSLPMAYYDKPSPARLGKFSHRTPGKTDGKVEPLSWPDLILPYTPGDRAFRCPGDHFKTPRLSSPLSYALNDYFYRQPKGVSRYTFGGGAVSELKDPAAKILLSETNADTYELTTRPDLATRSSLLPPLQRHDDGANYAFADGHVEWHKLPTWWKSPQYPWAHPSTAANNPAPQWFPWLANNEQRW